jgi:transketolase
MGGLVRRPFGDPVMMRKAYGEALLELGRLRNDLVVLTADVSTSDFSWLFEAAFPERFFNVGIAEPAMVDVAVGLANSGLVPVANTFAFLFATRALEMVRTHLCFGGANVKLAATYAGLSDSFDGPTHHSITDVAIMRSLPGMTVVVPADARAAQLLLPQVVSWPGPVYFRLCRNEVPQIFSAEYAPEIGKGVVLTDGEDVSLLACGVMVERALQAAERLGAEGIRARVVEIHTIKPLDTALISRCARETGAVVTAEEHSILGGLGGAVAECLGETCPVPMERVGIRDTFAESGPYAELLDKYGMSVQAIAEAVRRTVARKAGHESLAGQGVSK